MVVVDVYTKNVKLKYKTFLLSKATLVLLFSGIVSLVLPFILAYYSGGFWQKRDVVYEQPEVTFKGEYLFVTTTEDNIPIICSSFTYYKKFLGFQDYCVVIRVRETDQNFDGKTDLLDVTFDVKIEKYTKLSSISLILPLDYKLSVPCSFQMQSAIIYQSMYHISSTSKLSIYADLHLDQIEPLRCSKHDETYNFLLGEKKYQSFELNDILKAYSEKNLKTTLKNKLTTYSPTADGTFTISLTVKYPEQKIHFKPRFWQIVKFAWIQYITLYLIVSYIMFQMKKYIFDHNFVVLYKEIPNKNK